MSLMAPASAVFSILYKKLELKKAIPAAQGAAMESAGSDWRIAKPGERLS